MESKEAQNLSSRLEKFIKGSFRGIFDQKSTVELNNPFTVFGIKELEGTLRPIAMYIILDYIWTKVKQNLKKRLLIVDEAWYLMQYPDSATFLFSLAKRARKYYLGVTTITQDVEDFLATDQGKAIVTNSSIQILMKQSTAAIEKLSKVFHLSQGESRFLLSCGVGEGLFFAGQNHVAIRILASPEEHANITTNPQDILAQQIKDNEEKSSESKEKPAEKETLFALRTTANREDQVMDFVVSNVEKKKMDVWAVIRPHGMRGYVFIEAATRADAEQAAFNIPYARGILPKPVNYSEIDHMLEQVKIEKNIRKNDIVEIIAGPFKREQAKIARIDKQKEEVVVELLEAAIPIPITVKMDNVKVIRRDSESTEEEEERKEFTLPNQKKKVKEAEIPPEMDDEDEEQ